MRVSLHQIWLLAVGGGCMAILAGLIAAFVVLVSLEV